jgi:hypothetical protein
MKELNAILQKTIVAEYYRQNVVFYGGILLFAAGILRSSEHIKIGRLIVAHPSLLWLTGLIWALHTLKITLFTLRLFQNKSYEFLYYLRLFSRIKRFWLLINIQFLLILPTFFYSVFLGYLALETKNYSSIFQLLMANILFILVGFWAYDYRLKRPNTEAVLKNSFQKIIPPFRTLPCFFYLRFLFSKQAILLLLTIFWGVFVMLGVCNLYHTDDYDGRLLAIGGLFVVGGMIPIGQQFYAFEFLHLSFFRNLPLKILQRFLLIIISFLLVLLPVCVVIFNNLPHEISYFWAFSLILFILSFCQLLYSLNFIALSDKDNHWHLIFALIILFFILIMFKIPMLLLAIINYSVSFIIFKKQFYLSEYQPIDS